MGLDRREAGGRVPDRVRVFAVLTWAVLGAGLLSGLSCSTPAAASDAHARFDAYQQRAARCAERGLDTSAAMAEAMFAKHAYLLNRKDEAATRIERALRTLDGCVGLASLRPAALVGSATAPLREPRLLQVSDAASMTAGRTAHGVVPFRQGELRAGDGVLIRDGAGRALSAQARPLVAWRDGSTRWLALDVASPAAAPPVQPLQLTRVEGGAGGTPSKDARPMDVAVSPRGDEVELRTSALVLTVRRGAEAAALKYLRDGTLHDARVEVVVGDDLGEHALRIDAVALTSRGPLRSVVTLSGRHVGAPDLVSELDVALEAGAPLVTVKHAIVNKAATASPRIHRLELRVTAPGERVGSARFGAAGAVVERPVQGRDVALVQGSRRAFTVSSDPPASGREGSGWASAQSGSFAFAIAQRPFAEIAPVGLRVMPSGISALLWEPRRGDPIPPGVSFSHDVTLAFDPSRSRVERLVTEPPPSVHARPADLARTAALQPLGLSPPGSQAYDERVEAHFDALVRHLGDIDEGRRLDFGDWRLDTGAWANNEYDLAYALYLHWARRGEARYLAPAHRMAVHMRDVDVDHAASSVSRGLPSHHGRTHRESPYDSGHVWVQGLLVHWLLADDPRSLRVAREMGDALARWVERGDLGRTERNLGWPLIALTAVHEYTGDARSWRAASLLVETALRMQAESGCWPHPIEEDPGARGCESALTGVLLEGLAAYHRLTGDARVAQAMRGAAGWLRRAAWRDAWNAFVVKEGPRHANGPRWPDLNLLVAGPLAYTACLSADPGDKAFAGRVFQSGVAAMGPRSGKQMAQQMRGIPLYFAARQDPRCGNW